MTEKLMEYLNNYLITMRDEVPGLLSISVVDIATGKTYMNTTKSGTTMDVSELNRLQTSAIKYALKGLEHIYHHESEEKKFEDIIITLDEQIHIITTNLQSLMAYIIIDSKVGNIALAQSLHRKYYNYSVQSVMKEFGEENVKNHPFFKPKDVTMEIPQILSSLKEEQPKQQEEEKKRSNFLHDLFFN